MPRLIFLTAGLLAGLSIAQGQTPTPTPPGPLVEKIQGELSGPLLPEGNPDPAVPHGNLYAATRLGIQVCDQNGRVRAILPLPTPCGPVRSLCFGGEHFDVLYVTDGTQLFKRTLLVPGFAPWSAPIAVPNKGQG